MSSVNPGGDMVALRAFRDLVDPLPALARTYVGQGSTEMTYSTILQGAEPQDDNPFARQLIATSRHMLSRQILPSMDQLPGTWAPVFATPSDWAEEHASSRFEDLEVDLSGEGAGTGAFSVIGDGEPLSLRTRKGAHLVHDDTQLVSLRMKYLFVTLDRPWLNPMLFATRGWRLSGQRRAFCSSGELDENDGVMPLLPTGILLAKDVVVEADWAPTDQRLLDRAPDGGVSLGPLPLVDETNGSTLHVIAWVSRLLPLSPD